MALRWKNTLKDHHVTDEAAFLNRRQLMGGAAAGLGLAAAGAGRAHSITITMSSAQARMTLHATRVR